MMPALHCDPPARRRVLCARVGERYTVGAGGRSERERERERLRVHCTCATSSCRLVIRYTWRGRSCVAMARQWHERGQTAQTKVPKSTSWYYFSYFEYSFSSPTTRSSIRHSLYQKKKTYRQKAYFLLACGVV